MGLPALHIAPPFYSTSYDDSIKNLLEEEENYTARPSHVREITPTPNPYPKTVSPFNLLRIPHDFHSSITDLSRSLKRDDHEGTQDATFSLCSSIMNTLTSLGCSLICADVFHLTPFDTNALILPTYGIGIILYIIEGILDGTALLRHRIFDREFDFSILNDLKTLLDADSASKSYQAYTSLFRLMEHDETTFPPNLAKVLKALKNKIDDHPHFSRLIFQNQQKRIGEVAAQILQTNLSHLQEKYLHLSGNEVKSIRDETLQKFATLPSDERETRIESVLNERLNKKKITLARRIQPWLVCEASEITEEVLNKLKSSSDLNAVNKGLNLMRDISIQSKKKEAAYTLGVVAMIISAISLAILVVGTAPYTVPTALGLAATTLIFTRFALFIGSFNERGWHFSPNRFIPFSKSSPLKCL
jgi:hypothetical protein